VRIDRVGAFETALLSLAYQPPDQVVPVGKNEIAGREIRRLFAGAIALD
jgi:hypothetical protein